MEFLIILIILVFYGISYYIKKRVVPKIKGALGEYKVSTKLKRLKKKEYLILNNVLFKIGNSTTQIDHIVICKSGIFVIETKNYKGWIHGHENSEYWTQTIYKYKKKLRNPIKQNWVHVYAIKKILSEYNYVKYFPIVVFAGSGKLKNITTTLPVIYTNKLLKTIKKLNEQENLSYNQMKLISDKLHQFNIIDRKENRNHVKQVRKQIRERKKKEKLKICPRCGNGLIKKKGKYGRFYGCQNFPKCRYTLSIN
ncbi:NERD domain-containing protein [Aquimarina sp. Aq78]|uniref:NERD domain-containing protein n=1 Tax=Aquimarina sp. Aq78 TaxID=1191889 RepID=UPI000D0F09E7|nr:NERD domain-containing protein [Aquimarina sp. Aq78]